MLGDGGISRYQATVTLHTDEIPEYGAYVMQLIERLFSVQPSLYRREVARAATIVISRVGVVDFLQTLGLPQGNKITHGIDIPHWIKNDARYVRTCIRGLVDTDGCVFTHRYTVKGKEYSYKKLSFTSAAPSLLTSVRDSLRSFGLHPRITKGGKDVFLDSRSDVARYLELIGSHNAKHLRRYAL